MNDAAKENERAAGFSPRGANITGATRSGSDVARRSFTFVIPSLKDPRITVAAAQTLWVILGATVYYFNRDPFRLAVTVLTACVIDMLIALIRRREILVPISAYLTAMSIGILLESYDWRIYAVASTWGILSKYLVRNQTGHFFNPSNFGLVAVLLLCPHLATIAPGSQWGADYRIAAAIIILGLMMMKRIRRLELALSWIGGYIFMSLIRMALGQGGMIFALGPMTGAEFALFTFVMLPDPKASPPTPRGRIAWGFSIAVLDGMMRYMEIRYSMFYALFICCATLPLLRWAAARAGLFEGDHWKLWRVPMSGINRTTTIEPAFDAHTSQVHVVPEGNAARAKTRGSLPDACGSLTGDGTPSNLNAVEPA